MTKLLSAILVTFALAACDQQVTASPVLPSSDGAAPPAQTSAAPALQSLRGDSDKPLSDYLVINDGKLFLALIHLDQPGGPKLEELALALSTKYEREKDGFKRQDILKTITPEIEALLLRAKSQRYLAFDARAADQMETYNFQTKSFGLTSFDGESRSHYFSDQRWSTMTFDNSLNFRQMVVTDETAARTIEALRDQRNLTLRTYFFVSGYNALQSTLNAQVMAVSLIGPDGTVLATQQGK